MKSLVRLRRLCVVIATFALCSVAGAQTLTTNPANPTSDRTTAFVIRGDWPNGCTPQYVSGSSSGFLIRIEARANPSCAGCVTAVTPYQIAFGSQSPLPAGNYTLEFYVTDCNVRSLVKTFQFRVSQPGGTCNFETSLSVCPASVEVGEAITLLWCDPSPVQMPGKITFSSDAATSAVVAYRILNAKSPSGPFTLVKTAGPERTGAQLVPTAEEAGTNYFMVEADVCPSTAPCSPGQTTVRRSNVVATVVKPVTPACSTETVLCALNRRFRISVRYRNQFENPAREGQLVGRSLNSSAASETTAFWFHDRDNLEVLVKVLDARPFDPKIHVAFGAVTDIELWITVRDTVTGVQREYHKGPNVLTGNFDRISFTP